MANSIQQITIFTLIQSISIVVCAQDPRKLAEVSTGKAKVPVQISSTNVAERVLSGSVTALPAQLEIDVGEIPLGEFTKFWLEISNMASEPFVVLESRTDCGCILGYAENEVTKPGNSVRVYIKLRPTVPGVFNKKITLIGDKGSSRNIVIEVSAVARRKFDLQPERIHVSSTTINNVFEVKVTGNFGYEFSAPTVRLSKDSVFHVSQRFDESKKNVLLLQLSLSSASLEKIRAAPPMRELIHVEQLNCAPIELELPIVVSGGPQVRPSKFYLADLENRESDEIRFFIFGDTGFSDEERKASTVSVSIGSKEYTAVSSSWKSANSCVCSLAVPFREIPAGAECAVLNVHITSGAKKVAVGSLEFRQ